MSDVSKEKKMYILVRSRHLAGVERSSAQRLLFMWTAHLVFVEQSHPTSVQQAYHKNLKSVTLVRAPRQGRLQGVLAFMKKEWQP